MEQVIINCKNQLKVNGYTYIDLLDYEFVDKKDLKSVKKRCLKYLYKYFMDRGLAEKDIKLDFKKAKNDNQYFKKPSDSLMFKAMYGHKKKNGDFYINTRKPAIAKNNGMGQATSQPKIYHDKKLIKFKENLRPIFNGLYGTNTHLHLSRFGLKLPYKESKDMLIHTDMIYHKDYKNKLPKRRKINDPISYSPYSEDGVDQRLQSLLCLSDSESGWYGYEKSHLKFKEIGDKIGWPGLTKAPQPIPKKILEELELKRIDIKSKVGRLIMWNCGTVHGNSKCRNTTPRLVMYINYQPNNENTSAEKVVALGNQPKEI